MDNNDNKPAWTRLCRQREKQDIQIGEIHHLYSNLYSNIYLYSNSNSNLSLFKMKTCSRNMINLCICSGERKLFCLSRREWQKKLLFSCLLPGQLTIKWLCLSICHCLWLTIRAFIEIKSDHRDLWPLRPFINRVKRRHDLTNKNTRKKKTNCTHTNTKTLNV